jgi:hypothetical protein
VVEIKQQPRRGRGTHTAAPRGGEPPVREEADAPIVVTPPAVSE